MGNDEPRGVIFVLVAPDGTVLLQRRDHFDTRFPGSWCLPGGACEEGEDYLAAVLREAREEFEADLDPSACNLLMSRLGGRNWVFVSRIHSTENLRLREGAEMRWCSLNEVQSMALGFNQADIPPRVREYLESGGTGDESQAGSTSGQR
jgi:8-oxo-dGTP pyrophosphatase MutT (NUDIX family)